MSKDRIKPKMSKRFETLHLDPVAKAYVVNTLSKVREVKLLGGLLVIEAKFQDAPECEEWAYWDVPFVNKYLVVKVTMMGMLIKCGHIRI